MAHPFLLISILFKIIFSSYIFALFLQKIEFIFAELLILYQPTNNLFITLIY
jgi:hypothetical protein